MKRNAWFAWGLWIALSWVDIYLAWAALGLGDTVDFTLYRPLGTVIFVMFAGLARWYALWRAYGSLKFSAALRRACMGLVVFLLVWLLASFAYGPPELTGCAGSLVLILAGASLYGGLTGLGLARTLLRSLPVA